MEDGYVKEPAVGTRANFNPKSVDEATLERIKLEDGVNYHEHVRVALETYALQHQTHVVRPFMLVVTQDTTHARQVNEFVQSDQFFDGRYKGRVIEIHSKLTGEESDENAQRLLNIEKSGDTDIVIHVNKLKEGWDVTNLFTIVPLLASASEILTEKTLGRGLRLPYGKRTGVKVVDTLTVIAHERFNELIEKAKEENGVTRKLKAVTIGEGGDVPASKPIMVTAPSLVEQMVLQAAAGAQAATAAPDASSVKDGVAVTPPGFQAPTAPPFKYDKPEEFGLAKTVLNVVLPQISKQVSSIKDLEDPKVVQRIAEAAMVAHFRAKHSDDEQVRSILQGHARQIAEALVAQMKRHMWREQTNYRVTRVVAWLCAGKVGAVLCQDASRLARNGRDWHHLLELCGLVEARVIDHDGVYNPCQPNDRLLLGMKGSISEFELGVLRTRMLDAARSKARRGELRLSVPFGYIWHREAGLGLDPDLRLQEVIRLIFTRFRELGSARQVLLSMTADQIHFPRPSDEGRMTSFTWLPIRYRNVISVLKNPFYAGDYVYGKSEKRTSIVDGRARRSYGHSKPVGTWEVFIKDHHEGYVSWDEYERNQQQLALNNYGRADGVKSGRGGMRGDPWVLAFPGAGEAIPCGGWGLTTPRTLIAGVGPEPCGLRLAGAGGQHADGRVIGEDHFGRQHMTPDGIGEGFQQGGALADPVGQGRAIEVEPLAREDLALAIQGKMAGVFAHQHMSQQARPGTAAFDRARGQRGLDEAFAAGTGQPGRIIRFTMKRPGTYSSSSVTSSPIRRRRPPQSAQASAPGVSSTSIRGMWSGTGRRFGLSFSSMSGSFICAVIAAAAISLVSRARCKCSAVSDEAPNRCALCPAS